MHMLFFSSQVMYLHFFLGQGILAQPRTDKEKQYVADSTYILALDGDIDFQPEAVILLLDLMKRNVKVAAACGRIHPTGNGEWNMQSCSFDKYESNIYRNRVLHSGFSGGHIHYFASHFYEEKILLFHPNMNSWADTCQ